MRRSTAFSWSWASASWPPRHRFGWVVREASLVPSRLEDWIVFCRVRRTWGDGNIFWLLLVPPGQMKCFRNLVPLLGFLIRVEVNCSTTTFTYHRHKAINQFSGSRKVWRKHISWRLFWRRSKTLTILHSFNKVDVDSVPNPPTSCRTKRKRTNCRHIVTWKFSGVFFFFFKCNLFGQNPRLEWKDEVFLEMRSKGSLMGSELEETN